MKDYSEKRYAFIDTETGGIIPGKHSLLSVGVVIWEAGYGILDKKEFYIKSEEYVITQEAKRINKFDEAKHEKLAKLPRIVIKELLEFLKMYFDEGMYVPLAGHNVQFDINFLKSFFSENNRSFNQHFSHRVIDTYSVYKTLILSGLIDENINSSHDAFNYFGIQVKQRHDALSDCIATVELYEKMISLIRYKEKICCKNK